MRSVSITVTGLVQGVFFRKYAVEAAVRLGVSGFVMNLPEGSVYMEATGNAEQLKELERWCQEGSPRSKVMKVEIRQLPFHEYEGFVIRYG